MVSVGDPDRFFLRGHPRFRVEVLDDDVLLVDVQTSVVHRVPGPDVDLLLAGTTTLMSGHLPPGGAEAIRDALTTGTVRRRALLVGGGALAASGIISTALPFAAAALSFTYLPPADGGTFTTTAWGESEKSGTTDWQVGDAWGAARVATGVNNPSGAEPRTIQVLLHATSGTAYDDNTGDTSLGAGSGAYIVATVQLPPSSPQVYFSLRAGARGNVNRETGYGGMAVGAYTWDGGAYSSTQWFLVAGAGGGDGSGGPGGRWGVGGGGATPGTAAIGGTGGTGGTGTRDDLAEVLPATTGQGYDAITGSDLLGRGPSDSGSSRPSKVNFYPGASSFGGGGGGAGWASGGGGGTNSGGGGGSSYLRTSGGGPVVTASAIYSFPREWAQNGSTTRFEIYTA